VSDIGAADAPRPTSGVKEEVGHERRRGGCGVPAGTGEVHTRSLAGLPPPSHKQILDEERVMGRGTLGEGAGKYIPVPP